MSVLKNKRKESKAEFVNESYQIYIHTLEFISKLSARYSRLMASDISHTAFEVMRCAECANAIFPSQAEHFKMRESYLQEARANLKALDVAMSVCYDVLMKNPAGAFTTSSGKEVQSNESIRKIDNMAQSLGEAIDNNIRLITNVIKSDKERFLKQHKEA